MKKIVFRCVEPGMHESHDGLYTITRGGDGWTIFDSVTTWDGAWSTLNAAKRAVWQVEADADWQR